MTRDALITMRSGRACNGALPSVRSATILSQKAILPTKGRDEYDNLFNKNEDAIALFIMEMI